MAIEPKIYTLLTGSATVTNQVSTRIYVSNFPSQVTYPSILYTRVLGEPINTLDGVLSGAERVTIQIDSFSTEYQLAFNVSTIVHRIMDGSGTFKSIQLSNQDLSQQLTDMKRLYRISQRYSCWDK